MQQRHWLTEAASGVAAGLAAAFLMNRFQIGWSKASEALRSNSGTQGENDESGEPATVRAVEKLQGVVPAEPWPKDQRRVAGNLLHYGFGAVLGLFYTLAGRHRPAIRAGYGTAYGAGVSVAADEILVPAAGLAPPPSRSPASSHLFGLVSHVVFGAALEGSRRLIARING